MRTSMLAAVAGAAIGLCGVAWGQATNVGGGIGAAEPVRLDVPLNKGRDSYLVSRTDAPSSVATRVFDVAPDLEIPGFVLYNQVVVRAGSVEEVRKALAARPGDVAAGAPTTVSAIELPGWFLIDTGTVGQAVEIATYLQSSGQFDSVTVEHRPPSVNMALPYNDPLVGDQWHLFNADNPGMDLGVASVYAMGITGRGVTVGIIEAGEDNFLIDHPDLMANYDPFRSMRMTLFPVDQSHGTAVAGIIAATANNGEGIVGIAHDARLAAIRNGSTLQTMQALNWLLPAIQVRNNSWGFGNAPAPVILHFTSPDYVMDAIARAGHFGRGGKGSIVVWSSGNEGQYLYPFGARSDYMALTASRWPIVVGAVGEDNVLASYSNPGASVFVSAYSAGDAGRGITTANAPSFLNPDLYVSNFGGTSAAAPMVSGVIALMLDANGGLTLRDVKHILADTSDPLNFNSAAIYIFTPSGLHPFGSTYWQTNGGFKRHSDGYGFGLINAEAAVTAAMGWVSVKKPELFDTGVVFLDDTSIPDAEFVEFPPESGSFVINHTLGVANASTSFCVRPDAVLEEIEVTISVFGAWVGDLMITLTSPYDTVSALAVPRPDPIGSYTEYTFTTYKHWGELTSGNWTITMTDWIPAEPFDDNDGEYTVDLSPFGWDGIPGAGEKSWASYRVRMYGHRVEDGDFFLCPPLGQRCPGDMNGDGIVTVEDLMIFLELWYAGDPWADLNGDGLITYADLQIFLSNWAPGYCDPGPGPGGQNGRPMPGGGDVGTPIGPPGS